MAPRTRRQAAVASTIDALPDELLRGILALTGLTRLAVVAFDPLAESSDFEARPLGDSPLLQLTRLAALRELVIRHRDPVYAWEEEEITIDAQGRVVVPPPAAFPQLERYLLHFEDWEARDGWCFAVSE